MCSMRDFGFRGRASRIAHRVIRENRPGNMRLYITVSYDGKGVPYTVREDLVGKLVLCI